jgi:hypothetical protein
MIYKIDDIILMLGQGAFLRKKQQIVECEVELFHPDKRVEIIEWKLYHRFRNRGLGRRIAIPSKNNSSGRMFEGMPGYDEYYYYGLSEKGMMEFYLLQKEKKTVNEK